MSRYREQLDAQVAQLARQLAPYRTRFEALQPREQLFVAAAGVVVTLALIYLLLWQPFALARVHREQDLQVARALAARIETIGAQVQLAHPAGAAPQVGRDVSLLAAVDQAGKDGTLGKAPSRMQPDGDNQVRVWIDDVPFDPLLRWMDELQSRYGVRIDSVAIERRPVPGVVSARLSLVRSP